VELPFLLQCVQLVRSAYVLFADEDLRHGAPAGALRQGGARLVVSSHVDLLVANALALQQALGAHTVGAVGRRVDFHVLHRLLDARAAQKARDWPPSITTQAPATQLARG